MIANESPAAKLQLVGGAVCLDFVNTVGDRESSQSSEHMPSYADLVTWSQRANILTHRGAQQLMDEARRRPKEADRVYQRAIVLRETLYQIFLTVAEKKSFKSADLDLLNQTLAATLVNARIVSTKDGFVWGWSDEIELDRILWFIARSAADLLTSGNLVRVRQCDDDSCGWLFIDTSKNHSRRWCVMNDCGNRAKARRHYSRVRVASKS